MKKNESSEKIIPEGMVEIGDGSIIDKADMATKLRVHPKNPKLLYDRAGICYIKNKNGTLRRYPPKISKVERKEQKKLRWSRHE